MQNRLCYRGTVAKTGTLYFLVCLLTVFVLVPHAVAAFAGLGGYVSEKLLGSGVTTDSVLTLGRTASGPIVLGSGPVVATAPATGATMGSWPAWTASATLNGSLLGLSGAPSASVWFEWGYDPLILSHFTLAVNTAVLGDKSALISGFDPNRAVFFRIVAATDGPSRGTVSSFAVAGGAVGVYHLLRDVLTAVVALAVCVFFVAAGIQSGNLTLALAGVLIGVIAFVLVQGILWP